MPEHIRLSPENDLAALAKGLQNVSLMASRQRTSNSGSIFINDGQTDENGAELGTGTIIGAGSQPAPFVNDTTPPGKPTGLTAISHSGIVLVRWDGTLEGGIPADFTHITIHASYGDTDLNVGDLSSEGELPTGAIEPKTVVTVYAYAYDDAHNEQGEPTPNQSVKSDVLSVTVESSADTSAVEAAQTNAQKALDTASQAKESVDGKNSIFSSATEPDHAKLVKGDLWFKTDKDSHVTGIMVWDGTTFNDYVLMASEVLVAGSLGTIQLSDGAVTADKVTASEALLDKLLVRKITADDINVGSLSAAIVKSGMFKTGDSGNRVVIDSTGIKQYNSANMVTTNIPSDGSGNSMVGKFISGDPNGAHISMSTPFIGADVSEGALSFYDGNNRLIGRVDALKTTSTSNGVSISVAPSGVVNAQPSDIHEGLAMSMDSDGTDFTTEIMGGGTVGSGTSAVRMSGGVIASPTEASLNGFGMKGSTITGTSRVSANNDGTIVCMSTGNTDISLNNQTKLHIQKGRAYLQAFTNGNSYVAVNDNSNAYNGVQIESANGKVDVNGVIFNRDVWNTPAGFMVFAGGMSNIGCWAFRTAGLVFVNIYVKGNFVANQNIHIGQLASWIRPGFTITQPSVLTNGVTGEAWIDDDGQIYAYGGNGSWLEVSFTYPSE